MSLKIALVVSGMSRLAALNSEPSAADNHPHAMVIVFRWGQSRPRGNGNLGRRSHFLHPMLTFYGSPQIFKNGEEGAVAALCFADARWPETLMDSAVVERGSLGRTATYRAHAAYIL